MRMARETVEAEGPMQTEQFISRKQLAGRWSCSTETIKRRTRDGLLHPIRFNARMIRYPLSQIILIEQEAGGQR